MEKHKLPSRPDGLKRVSNQGEAHFFGSQSMADVKKNP